MDDDGYSGMKLIEFRKIRLANRIRHESHDFGPYESMRNSDKIIQDAFDLPNCSGILIGSVCQLDHPRCSLKSEIDDVFFMKYLKRNI